MRRTRQKCHEPRGFPTAETVPSRPRAREAAARRPHRASRNQGRLCHEMGASLSGERALCYAIVTVRLARQPASGGGWSLARLPEARPRRQNACSRKTRPTVRETRPTVRETDKLGPCRLSSGCCRKVTAFEILAGVSEKPLDPSHCLGPLNPQSRFFSWKPGNGWLKRPDSLGNNITIRVFSV